MRNQKKWYNRDYDAFVKMQTLINNEIKNNRAYGETPISFDFFIHGIQAKATSSKEYLSKSYGPSEISPLTGRGLLLKGVKDGKPKGQPQLIKLMLPRTPVDVCGVLIGGVNNTEKFYVDSFEIHWRSDLGMKFDMLTDPKTGNSIFNTKLSKKNEFRAIFFDSVPAKYFIMKLFYKGDRPGIRITFIHSCYYPNTKFLSDCGEKLDHNSRFDFLPVGTPISIKCPIDCILYRQCWGYKVYSSDSAICYSAVHAFGRYADGLYTLYKIANVSRFIYQPDPSLNHKAYCRGSSVQHSGFTFERRLYDEANKEYESHLKNTKH
uniref:Adhesive organ protein 1 n=1 Tax=Minona ileanae TaxID=60013 RepID=A0A5J6BUC9_9PLAT|nr:adhesive organ protein 1 [Minona ileanae]